MTRRLLAAATLAALLSACQQQDGPADSHQRMALAGPAAAPRLKGDSVLASPDTTAAAWRVDEDGQSIHFGEDGAAPLLSLDCRLGGGTGGDAAQMAIIRHAPALPGQGALFPVIGNGMRSRFLADAQLAEGEWRWEAVVPADDPQLDVFTGTADITATLPGKGRLDIEGSRIPGEFVEWCRAGGRVVEAEAQEEALAPN